MDASTLIASLIGPVLMAVTTTETLNLKIWQKVEPSLVHLNGLILFAAGLAILRFHPGWSADWRSLVTLSGWMLLAAGLYRMLRPAAPQMGQGPATYVLTGLLWGLGLLLTIKGYA